MSALRGLLLLQVLTIILGMIASALQIRAIYGSGAHPDIAATYLRDCGAWLFLIPVGWYTWSVWSLQDPSSRTPGLRAVVITGGLLFFFLLIFVIKAGQVRDRIRLHNAVNYP